MKHESAPDVPCICDPILPSFDRAKLYRDESGRCVILHYHYDGRRGQEVEIGERLAAEMLFDNLPEWARQYFREIC